MASGKLYLIPSLLAPNSEAKAVHPYLQETIKKLDLFLVENARTSRRFISALNLGLDISSLEFKELNKDTPRREVESYLKMVQAGRNAGVLSEAGCPGIADPGAVVVALAHQRGIAVESLSGPSSILLALMASGFSGQHFTFHGYLPIQEGDRIKALKLLESTVQREGSSQLFIETPYRNQALLRTCFEHLAPQSLLCISADIQGEKEMIRTLSIRGWKKNPPELHKIPAIFILGKSSL